MKVLRFADNWDPGHAAKSFSRGKAHLGKSSPHPVRGGFSPMLRECRWARPEVVCCSRVMGSRPRWAKSFCSTYCKETQRWGHHTAPLGFSSSAHFSHSLFLKMIQFYLEKFCLKAFALINIWYWVSLFYYIFRKK